MPPAPHARSHARPESLTAVIRLRGQEFSFRLYTRPLPLGPHGTIQYYWMDASQFRGLSAGRSADNFRNCVGHWAAAMHAAGLGKDMEQHLHYVTALCYSLVSNDKSMQGVYRDAFLTHGRTNPTDDGLPDAVRRRICKAVRSRDRALVQQELDRALGWSPPAAEVMPAMREAFRRWVGTGVARMREKDNDGLTVFLKEVKYWLGRYRKKGGGERVRQFINLFACEAKVSFYTCYANAWIDLIPWLRKHRGLDPVSERFLWFWHHQNQPVEVPHGRTPAGVYYPTEVRYDFSVGGLAGAGKMRSIGLPTERIGPTHLPDVFRGQVLSLHPLSGFFMRDTALCEAAGRLFFSDRYEEIRAHGRDEYWKLIGAILAGAHLYRRAADAQLSKRGVRSRGGDAVMSIAGGDDKGADKAMMKEFAEAQKVVCPHCHKPVHFNQYFPAEGDGRCRVEFACRSCDLSVEAYYTHEVLTQWFMPAD